MGERLACAGASPCPLCSGPTQKFLNRGTLGGR